MDFKTILRKAILKVVNPNDPEVCEDGKHCAKIAGQEWPEDIPGEVRPHASTHEPAGADEVNDIDIGNTGVLLSAHQARHRPAGADPLPVGAPSNIGTANAAGAVEEFVRQDHIHNHPAALGFALHHDHYARMLWNVFHKGVLNGGAIPTGGIYGLPLQVPFTLTIDQLGIVIGNVVAGNIRMAIYTDNGDDMSGGALVVESASIAVAGISRKQELPIADTQLTLGLYWICFKNDADALVGFQAQSQNLSSGTLVSRAVAEAYGAFGDPCPAGSVQSTDTHAAMYVRVASIP